MRTTPSSITASFEGDLSTLARCVKLQLRDGTELHFTDHDEDLEVDIGDGSYAATYRPDLGILSGDLELAVGLDADNIDIQAPIGDVIRREAVIGRRFNHARAWIFDVDWRQEVPQVFPMMKGRVSEARLNGNYAVLEIRSLTDHFNQSIGRLLSPRCTATFGDEQCGVTPFEILATVTAVGDTLQFSIDQGGIYEDSYFRFGLARFISGDLADTWFFDIWDYDGDAGIVTMLEPLPGLPAVGDTLRLLRGCSNVKSSEDPTMPTCLSYNNVRRFRGFDRVPGSDVYLRVPIPGESS